MCGAQGCRKLRVPQRERKEVSNGMFTEGHIDEELAVGSRQTVMR
jgi:hypothetical protein